MARLFLLTSAMNRESILAHGLDWTRMGAAPGIAGSPVPEKEGVFLCCLRRAAGAYSSEGHPAGVTWLHGIRAGK